MAEPLDVGVIGLGTMGAPMARHLVEAGHRVTVWNRTRAKEEPLAALGAARASSPAEAAGGADVVLTCVSDEPDLREVVLGPDGVAQRLASGAVLVDSSTVSPTLARELASVLDDGGRLFVDAPVSGGSEGAQKGTLTVFAGGSDAAVAKARPVLEAFSGRITHLGPAGAGQAAKAVNQLVIAGAYAALGEGLVYGQAAGLPMDALVEALLGGAANSWIVANRSANVISGSYPLGFRTSLHLKDVRIGLREASALGLELPVADLVASLEQRLVDAGYADEDVSNLARIVRGEA
ncbi:NAD(P)-dependent oxidoreductase [Spongisporangium articulatum]|uniref:NAD(P)-dependent oxidoreductase n=1 Tax=Spongisporangium articulatum TaxID=3362603 RepID=A0ABW8AMJ6_9ACTN